MCSGAQTENVSQLRAEPLPPPASNTKSADSGVYYCRGWSLHGIPLHCPSLPAPRSAHSTQSILDALKMPPRGAPGIGKRAEPSSVTLSPPWSTDFRRFTFWTSRIKRGHTYCLGAVGRVARPNIDCAVLRTVSVPPNLYVKS